MLQENEHQPDVSWDGPSADRDKIRHYIKLMVEGSNDLRYRPPRLGAGPTALVRSLKIACARQDITAGGARYNFRRSGIGNR